MLNGIWHLCSSYDDALHISSGYPSDSLWISRTKTNLSISKHPFEVFRHRSIENLFAAFEASLRNSSSISAKHLSPEHLSAEHLSAEHLSADHLSWSTLPSIPTEHLRWAPLRNGHLRSAACWKMKTFGATLLQWIIEKSEEELGKMKATASLPVAHMMNIWCYVMHIRCILLCTVWSLLGVYLFCLKLTWVCLPEIRLQFTFDDAEVRAVTSPERLEQ